MPSVALPRLVWGSPSVGRALLVHGLTSSAQVWWRVGSELAVEGWEVTAVDLRGHGAAPRTISYRLDEMAGDLLALDDHWDVVIGHSLGGSLALKAAVARASFCERLVLIDPVLAVANPRKMKEELAAELSPPSVAELLTANPRWHPEDAFWKRASALTVSPYVVERVFSDNPDWDLWPALARLEIPAVVLVAETGSLLGEGEAPSGSMVRFEVVAGCGHSIQRDDPGAVTREILGNRA